MAVNLTVYLDGATDQTLDIKSAGVAESMIGDLDDLTNTNKSSVVAALNEKANGTGLTFTVSNGILTVTY